jgi:transposase
VKAIACELPASRGLPLSRFSIMEIRRTVLSERIVKAVGGSTIWRWLDEDALRPWRHHPWIFPRDPAFAEKAGRVLDLYQGVWEGEAMGPNDYVISADEKTSIQARDRRHRTEAPCAGRAMRVEHEYRRGGVVAYLAALDVFGGCVMGRVSPKTGIAPFNALIELVMSREPYASAERVFWIVDNGSSHRPGTFPARLAGMYPNAIAVHLPIHASWLNQIEIFFSILQRKLLTPNDFSDTDAVRECILRFEARYNATARPFHWTFTRDKLNDLLQRLDLAA